MALVDAADAARRLIAGEVVALPTDTLYGLAALVGDRSAIDRIFSLKGRPQDKPLPVLGASAADLEQVVVFDAAAASLARKFWPGPLTIVLHRTPGFTNDLGGNVPTVGVRIPDSEDALAVLRRTGPLAVTSANPSGRTAATTAAEVQSYFGDEVPVLDGGPTGGEASTTITLDGGLKVLRAGALSADELRQSLMS